jgi:hypothetical protein
MSCFLKGRARHCGASCPSPCMGHLMTTAKLNFTIGVAAICSPAWMDALKETSQIAAALVPFFGLALVIMQMIKLGRGDK